jgi:tetratricopeptide (TPR) repeat protein
MKGNLSRGVLPGLLRELFVTHRSGLLHVTRGSERRIVSFQDGRIVGAQASDPEEQMGPVLVRQGYLAQLDLDRARQVMTREQKRLGRALRDLGVWDEARKEEALALHAREILLKLFSWTEGAYAFEELPYDAGAGADETTRKLSTGQLILDAARGVEDFPVVHEALGDLDRVLVLAGDAMLRFQNIMLTPADGYVLSRVDGEMSAREVLQLAPFSLEEAEKSLYCLLCTGALEYKPVEAPPGAAPRPAAAPRAAAPAPPAAPPPPAAAAAPPGAAQAEPKGISARRREVLEKFAGLKAQSHFEVLEIAPDAGADKVKDAYFRLAKRFHPDAHHREAVLEDIKDKLEAIFIRLGEAYDVLRNPRTRANYQSGLHARGPAVAAPVMAAGPGPVMVDQAEQSQRDTVALRKAEKAAEQEKHWDVIQLLEGVIPRLAGKQRQRARMALGRAYLKNPNWLKEGEELVRQVVAEDPRHAAAHLLLGQLYKERGLKARAISMLRKAVELDPENEQAHADLATLVVDVPPPVQESGGLLKKLFGRS